MKRHHLPPRRDGDPIRSLGARIKAWGEELASRFLSKPSPVPIRVEQHDQPTDRPGAGAVDGSGHMGIRHAMNPLMTMLFGLGSATLWLVLLEVTDFSAITVGLGLLVALAIIS